MSEFDAADFTGSEPVRAEREGLPAGYRMRADAHYVDLLAGSPRSDRGRDAARAIAIDDLARTGASSRQLLDHLAEDVASIESAAALLAGDRSPLMRRVGLDLIKAQATRASWLLRANALLNSPDIDDLARRRPLGEILAQVRERLAVECRLMGVGLDVQITPDAAAVLQPEAAVSAGVSGAILAQLGLVASADQPVIRVRAALETGENRGVFVQVTQDSAPVPAGTVSRFFDIDWSSRPGGWLAAIGASTARAAAERLGGSAVFTSERRGGNVNLALP